MWKLDWLFFSHQSSCSSVMHFSYTGPRTSLWPGKMLSCWRMKLLTRALICGCRETASCWSWCWSSSCSRVPLTKLGPKHTARLYGCIMFSSLYCDTLGTPGKSQFDNNTWQWVTSSQNAIKRQTDRCVAGGFALTDEEKQRGISWQWWAARGKTRWHFSADQLFRHRFLCLTEKSHCERA